MDKIQQIKDWYECNLTEEEYFIKYPYSLPQKPRRHPNNKKLYDSINGRESNNTKGI